MYNKGFYIDGSDVINFLKVIFLKKDDKDDNLIEKCLHCIRYNECIQFNFELHKTHVWGGGVTVYPGFFATSFT